MLLGKFPLKQTVPGKYSIQITALDNISNRTVTTSTDFKIKESIIQKLVAEIHKQRTARGLRHELYYLAANRRR